MTDEQPSKDEAEIRRRLRGIYLPEGVEIWLHNPHRRLDGECAIDVLRTDPDRVLNLIEQLETGSFT